MLGKIFSTIFNIIVALAVTSAGIVLRSVQLYCFQGDEKFKAGSIILFVLSVVFYIVGFSWSRYLLDEALKADKDDDIPGAIISVILSVALQVFFMFYTPAGILIGEKVIMIIKNIISCIISILVILFVIFMMIGAASGEPGTPDAMDEFMDENLKKVRQQAEEEHNRYETEKREREKYVRDNWNSSLGRLNSDATMYQTSDGNWNKISRDGKSYEDSNGNWEHL